MSDEIKFTEEVSKAIAEGQLVLLAVLFYRPEDESVQFFSRDSVSREEVVAMLRKYKVIPPDDSSTP